MGHSNIHDQKYREQLRHLVGKGTEPVQISKLTGVALTTTYRHIRLLGLNPLKRTHPLDPYEETLRALYWDGMPITTMAEKFETSHMSMSRYVKQRDFVRMKEGHPAVKELPETTIYKLANSEFDREANYKVNRASGKHMVYLSMDEYIELWEKAHA